MPCSLTELLNLKKNIFYHFYYCNVEKKRFYGKGILVVRDIDLFISFKHTLIA